MPQKLNFFENLEKKSRGYFLVFFSSCYTGTMFLKQLSFFTGLFLVLLNWSLPINENETHFDVNRDLNIWYLFKSVDAISNLLESLMSKAICKFVSVTKKLAIFMTCFTQGTVCLDGPINTKLQISLKECKWEWFDWF